MKKKLILLFLSLASLSISAQEVLYIKNGASITVQNGAELSLQGGITLENGSSLTNNGTVRLKNNPVANMSDWTDNSATGALSGTGLVIFNSINNHNFSGATSFYAVQMNAGGLLLNNNFQVSNLLHLINGKINTGVYYVFLNNNSAVSLLNDASNTGYINCWINGNFRRLITSNTNSYDFPVGNSTRSNLLQFANNNITGTNYLTASFGAKQGTDAGLNVTENGNTYTAVNNGGVWYLVPDAVATGGNYALQLYFNGFAGLADNKFGILRRPDASSNAGDWIVPSGSSLEPNNGAGRKLSDGFARRINISDFSQLGIGTFTAATPVECNITGAAEVCSGSTGNTYTAPAGMSSYNWLISGNGSIIGLPTGPSVTVTAAGSGNFTLTLITSLNGIPAQCTKTVAVSSTPVCDITGATEVCSGSRNNVYSGPAGKTTYLWTISAGGFIDGLATSSSVNIVAGAPGSFILTLDATIGNVCISHCTKMVTVNTNVVPSVSIGVSATTICSGTQVTFTATPTNGGTQSYQWKLNGINVGSNSSTYQNGSLANGDVVTVVMTSSLACANPATATSNAIIMMVNSNSVSAGRVSGTSPLCIAQTATYSSNGTGGGSWSSSNTSVASVNSSTGVVTALSAGTTNIVYSITGTCGTVNALKMLTVNPNVSAGVVSGVTPLIVGTTSTYNSIGTPGGSWSSANTGIATVNASTGLVTAVSAGTTNITYTVSSGCGALVSAFQTLTVMNNGGVVICGPRGDKVLVCHNGIELCIAREALPAHLDHGDIAGHCPALNTSKRNEPVPEPLSVNMMVVSAYPNPYVKQFSLRITSPVSGIATIDFFAANGSRIYQTKKYIPANMISILPYRGSYLAGAVLYSVTIGNYRSSGFVIHPN
jgi:hypothetical protein